MGRLFWKFFFFFWLAQLLTSVGVGVTIWALHPERHEFHRPPPPAMGPPPAPAEGFGPPPPPGPRHEPGFLAPPVMPLLAGSVVSLLFAALLAWYFARPIRNLRGAFEAVAGGALDARVGARMGRRRDELADLGTDFDRMAERLQTLVDGQRRLLHDVSHELRSPLARLQAACDLIRQQPERGRDLVERIERDTARIDRLVGELLTLARLDSGTAGDFDATADLHELLGDIADDAEFEAQAKGCHVALDCDGPLPVAGNAELLHRAFENVVRNALRHSPAGGTIGISARTSNDATIGVEITDEGAGVPDAELEAIFAPFVRGGAGAETAGYGLGLAITRRVLAAHGGSVTAANRAAGGLVVMARLPRLSG